MESVFTCSVYFSRERFSKDGCCTSYEANLNYDPYPCGVVTPGGIVARWLVFKFNKEWKTQQYCGYFIPSKTIQKLIKKKKIYIGTDGALYDSVSKEIAVLPRELWEGKCLRCGRCCHGLHGIIKCKYLKPGIESDL